MKTNLLLADTMKKDIEGVGFTEVAERRIQFPVGTWSSDFEYKTRGKWFRQVWWTGMEGWILMCCTRYLGVKDLILKSLLFFANVCLLVVPRTGPGFRQRD